MMTWNIIPLYRIHIVLMVRSNFSFLNFKIKFLFTLLATYSKRC